MLDNQQIVDILKAAHIQADEISKVLACWFKDDVSKSQGGLFIKLKDSSFAYHLFQLDHRAKRVIAPLCFRFYDKQPSLATLDKNASTFGTTRPWISDSKGLEIIRKEIWKLKTSKQSELKEFMETPKSSPVASRTPSPEKAAFPTGEWSNAQGDLRNDFDHLRTPNAQLRGPSFIDECGQEHFFERPKEARTYPVHAIETSIDLQVEQDPDLFNPITDSLYAFYNRK